MRTMIWLLWMLVAWIVVGTMLWLNGAAANEGVAEQRHELNERFKAQQRHEDDAWTKVQWLQVVKERNDEWKKREKKRLNDKWRRIVAQRAKVRAKSGASQLSTSAAPVALEPEPAKVAPSGHKHLSLIHI